MSDEKFLLRLNTYLRQFDSDDKAEDRIYPVLFIIGLQRSGTTLLSQLLAKHFDIGYINNLMARFWLNPVVGIRVSQNILGDQKNISFASEYGNTSDVSEPHEFGHFWKYWLKIAKDDPDELTADQLDKIDWTGLKRELVRITSVFGKPVFLKQLMLGFQASRIAKEIPFSKFVYIDRNLTDIAKSTLRVRRRRYGRDDAWFGLKPKNFREIMELSPLEQIVGKMLGCRGKIRREADSIDPDRIIWITYNDLCNKTKDVLSGISNHFNLKADIDNIPSLRSFSGAFISPEEEDYFKQKLGSYV